MDDPKALAKPWETTFYYENRPNWELGEISCSGDYLDWTQGREGWAGYKEVNSQLPNLQLPNPKLQFQLSRAVGIFFGFGLLDLGFGSWVLGFATS